MKNKKLLIPLILCALLIIGLTVLLVFYIVNKDNKKESTDRTVLEYVTGNITYDNALSKGREYFIDTIKLVANDYLEYDESFDGNINLYLVNNVDGYVKVKNYGLIKNFLNDSSIKIYNDEVGYVSSEGNDYIKNYKKDIFTSYVGSIIDIETITENIIEYKAINYYCNNYQFVGLLESKPTCNITKESESTFTLVNENNILKINNLNEFLDTKKIY